MNDKDSKLRKYSKTTVAQSKTSEALVNLLWEPFPDDLR